MDPQMWLVYCHTPVIFLQNAGLWYVNKFPPFISNAHHIAPILKVWAYLRDPQNWLVYRHAPAIYSQASEHGNLKWFINVGQIEFNVPWTRSGPYQRFVAPSTIQHRRCDYWYDRKGLDKKSVVAIGGLGPVEGGGPSPWISSQWNN